MVRLNIIAPASMTAELNALWTVITPNGDDEAKSFGIPCSADGNLPATYSAIGTHATDEMVALINNIFADELAGVLMETVSAGTVNLTEFIEANGLKVINE